MLPLSREEALDLSRRIARDPHDSGLAADAISVRLGAFGNTVTYSPKVFIPLTMLCRDVCHYCTFAKPPEAGQRAFMPLQEVVELAQRGVEAGCHEALFTLGDKPELRYRVVREELHAMGFDSTLAYLRHAARSVLDETGLLPHLNPGVMTASDIEQLRTVAPSMGLMLESVSERLMSKGLPHHGSPDKHPQARLATLNEAGRQRVPFTTGLLIGIGESWEERAETLWAIAESHDRWGHVQEVIVQNFRAKPSTVMARWPEPGPSEMFGTIVLARLILQPEISIQAPPNLADSEKTLTSYLDAGINDWGGVSPVTVDHVNPEAPWPEIQRLRESTESAGFNLVPRLTIYPRYALNPEWVDPSARSSVLALADTSGHAREERWFAGDVNAAPSLIASAGNARLRRRREFESALDDARQEVDLTQDQIATLFTARGDELHDLVTAADQLRRDTNGDVVTYVVNRNINYTNMCYYKCGFCAFSKGPKSLNLRGDPYLISFEEIANRTLAAYEAGATEVCLQGGIHPSFTGDFYVEVCRTIKRAVPDMHIHAFSPLEVWQGAQTKGVSVRDFLWELKDAGLATLPGTAAEILDDSIRAIICPDKIDTEQWSFVAKTAHSLGLPMTTTMMFGHADDFASWARHFIVLRDIQKETGGFTEFVPLPFVHMGAPIYLKGKARRGPTFSECIKVHAVARLALHPWITNIQASWVKLGLDGAARMLEAGCNDLGGTLMNESISRAAGASHGQEVPPEGMRSLIEGAGRQWARRNTIYEILEGPPSLDAAAVVAAGGPSRVSSRP